MRSQKRGVGVWAVWVLACMSVLAGGPAGAGDSTASQKLPQGFDWSGWYVGGHIANSLGRVNSTLSDPEPTASNNSFGSLYGGVQAGYNYVLPSRLLLGVEADITFPNFQTYTDGLIFTGSNAAGHHRHRPDRLYRDAARSFRLRVRSLAHLRHGRVCLVAGALRRDARRGQR